MKQYLNFNHGKINNYSLQHQFLSVFKKIELIFFVLLSLIFLTVSKLNQDFRNDFSYFFVDISTPFVNVATLPFNLTINLLVNFQELVDAKKENKTLREDSDKMRLLLVKTIDIENENQELKNILKYIIPRSLNYKMAKITGRVQGSFNQQLFVEARHDVEIKEGSAVVGNMGLIGRTADAVGNRARLILPTDANSHIPIIVSKARARGILVGNNSNLMEIEYLAHNHKIAVGDLVFTSSDGEYLPPGILIGIVKKVDGNYVAVEMAQDIVSADVITIVEY